MMDTLSLGWIILSIIERLSSFTGKMYCRLVHRKLYITPQMGNLKQLHVHCGRPDVLITRSYGEFLVHQALRTGTAESSHPSLVLTGGDINLNTAFFFLPKYIYVYMHCALF